MRQYGSGPPLVLAWCQSRFIRDTRVDRSIGKCRTMEIKGLQEASASSSFLRLILSLRPSASRRAAAILFCICSLDISDDMFQDSQLGGGGKERGSLGGLDPVSWDGDAKERPGREAAQARVSGHPGAQRRPVPDGSRRIGQQQRRRRRGCCRRQAA